VWSAGGVALARTYRNSVVEHAAAENRTSMIERVGIGAVY
jgi:hypothetical protein